MEPESRALSQTKDTRNTSTPEPPGKDGGGSRAISAPNLPPVRAVENLLRRTPGNEALNERWDWEGARRDSRGEYVVPPADSSGLPLRIVTEKRLSEACGATATACVGQDESTTARYSVYISAPSRTSGPQTLSEIKKWLDAIGVKVKRPLRPADSDVFHEASVLHESSHADDIGKSLVQDKGEFRAFRKEFDYLSDRGIIEPVSNDTILKSLMTYPPEVFASGVLDACGGFTAEARRRLPGGDLFKTWSDDYQRQIGAISRPQPGTLALLARLREIDSSKEPWNTEFGRGVIAGAQNYFTDKVHAKLASENPKESVWTTQHDRRFVPRINAELGESMAAFRKGMSWPPSR